MIFSACDFRIENATAPAVWASNLTKGVFNYSDPGINNDPTMRTGGSLSVGAFSRPAPAYIGGGGDFTQFMHVFSDDGTSGSYVDNTVAARSANSSTFSLLQGTSSGSVAFFGNQVVKFPAIFVNVSSSGSYATSSADAVWEYYGSSGWTEVDAMASTAAATGQYANQVFNRTGSEYIRFDVDSMYDDWITGSVNGQNGYWVRWRVTGSIATVPTLERVMLAADRTDFASSGFLKKFGGAEHRQKL